MNSIFQKCLGGWILVSSWCLAFDSQAQVTIDYSVAGISQFTLLPGTGTYPAPDTLTVSSYSSGPVVLDYGVPQTLELNAIDFFTAYGDGDREGILFSLARDLSVDGGAPQSIIQNGLDDYEGPYDTLNVYAGSLLAFTLPAGAGTLYVSPLEATAGGPAPAPVFGDHLGDIDATFEVLPERSVPDQGATGLLLGIGLGGLGILRRRVA
jgi:hypothetical protein